MFSRIRGIERALIESEREVPKTAIIQPCMTVFTLASLGRNYLDSTVVKEMFAAHCQVLLPGNYPHDYLPEEMVLDGKSSLDEYTLLILPYAPYMTERFSQLLADWVHRGGTLVAFGPFAVDDECGFELPAEKSLFRTCFPKIGKIGAGDWDYGEAGKLSPPAMEVKKHGQGTLAYLNRAADVVYRSPSLREPLESLLARVGQRTATSPDADLKIAVREKTGGEKYLCLCNTNVERPIETTVTVGGKYRQALDIVVPGWFPVPLESKGDATLVKIRLDPGDFTMVLLK
jgi:hypothetical protein